MTDILLNDIVITDISLKEIVAKKNEYVEFEAKWGKEAIKLEFNSFFKKYPFVNNIRWIQFIPYFNDGDPCEFDIHPWECIVNIKEAKNTLNLPDEFTNSLNEYNDDDDEYDDNDDSNNDYSDYSYGMECFVHKLEKRSNSEHNRKYHFENLIDFNQDTQEFITAFNDLCDSCITLKDLIQSVFGDHSFITATKEGIDIRNYEDHN